MVQCMADSIVRSGNEDVISMTDMLKAKDVEFFISDWLCHSTTCESPAIWGSVFEPAFNYGECALIKRTAGINSHQIKLSYIGIRLLCKLSHHLAHEHTIFCRNVTCTYLNKPSITALSQSDRHKV